MTAEKKGTCERYKNEEDIVYEYLIDYASHLERVQRQGDPAIANMVGDLGLEKINELGEHYGKCPSCMKRVQNWVSIFKNSRKKYREELKKLEK